MLYHNTKKPSCIIAISNGTGIDFLETKIIQRSRKPFPYPLEPLCRDNSFHIYPAIFGNEELKKEFFLVYVPELFSCYSLCFEDDIFLPSASGAVDAETVVLDGYQLPSSGSDSDSLYTKETIKMSKLESNKILLSIYDYVFKNIDNLNETLPISELAIDFGSFDTDGVKDLISKIEDIIAGSRVNKKLTKPDPLAALLMSIDRPGRQLTEEEYEQFEQARIADKWRGNRIGDLNEAILNIFQNVTLSEAGKLDIIVNDKNGEAVAIAEVKNRYNTMNAASAIRTRHAMESLVLDRGATYYNADAILVERIPKADGRETKFNPSDPARGTQGADTDKIKRMGMQQFFTKYCEDELAYIKAIILVAQVLRGKGIITDDFDMKFIFKLLKKSVS